MAKRSCTRGVDDPNDVVATAEVSEGVRVGAEGGTEGVEAPPVPRARRGCGLVVFEGRGRRHDNEVLTFREPGEAMDAGRADLEGFLEIVSTKRRRKRKKKREKERNCSRAEGTPREETSL